MLTVRVSITFGMASIIEDLGTRGEASVEIWTVVPGGPNGCSDLEPGARGSVGRQNVDGFARWTVAALPNCRLGWQEW